MNYINAAHRFTRSAAAKIGAGTTALIASGAALASGSSPGAAIAGEVSGGKADMGLVIGACAVLIGLLLVWGYTRKAARP